MPWLLVHRRESSAMTQDTPDICSKSEYMRSTVCSILKVAVWDSSLFYEISKPWTLQLRDMQSTG